LSVDRDATVPADRIPQHGVVSRQDPRVGLAPELGEQPRRALDVREEERDGAFRQRRHAVTIAPGAGGGNGRYGS
jgi:hypothetical protein